MPKQCPVRPPDDFNLDLIQLHIARIRTFLESLAEIRDAYFYLVSWDNTALTSLSLIVFVVLCLKLKAEYFGRFVFSVFVMVVFPTPFNATTVFL